MGQQWAVSPLGGLLLAFDLLAGIIGLMWQDKQTENIINQKLLLRPLL